MAFELTIRNDSIECTSSISAALEQADMEMKFLNETIESIKKLKPDCDRLDYLLAACSGVLCGFIDILLVGIGLKTESKILLDFAAGKAMMLVRLSGFWNRSSKFLMINGAVGMLAEVSLA